MDVKYLPQMVDKDHRRARFVAIDYATRWVYVELCDDKGAATARRFRRHLQKVGFYPTTVDGLIKRPDSTARVTDEKLARTSRRGGVFIGSWSTEPPIVFWEIPSTTKDVVGY